MKYRTILCNIRINEDNTALVSIKLNDTNEDETGTKSKTSGSSSFTAVKTFCPGIHACWDDGPHQPLTPMITEYKIKNRTLGKVHVNIVVQEFKLCFLT